jgi:hypothetical protein
VLESARLRRDERFHVRYDAVDEVIAISGH